MELAKQQRNPAKHIVGIAIVIVLHVGVIYALVNGLARRVVEVMIRQPIETKIIEEVKPPPADVPPPLPPPMLAAPPPPYIPPPEVRIQQPPPQQNMITAVTNIKPVEPTPPAVVVHAPEAPPAPPALPAPPARPHETVRVPPVIDAARSCQKPEYPSTSRRLGETGTVTLHMLIDVDGRVIKSEVVSSSRHSRLDRAAQEALSLCRFKPGTVDGKPVQSWALLQYEWKLED